MASWLAGAAIAALALTACGGPGALAPDLLEPAKPGEAFDGQQCSAVRPPTEPDLMAWDAGSRLNLKSQGEQGVVAVRYEAKGCNVELEVLNCVGEGNYRFSPYKANESKLAKSSRDLYTELPLGAARLGGKVGGGRALRADYMLAGILSLPPMQSFDPASLTGDCERATHVVGRLYLGGFAMASGLSEELSSGASVFSAGAGGNQQRSAERLSEEGDASACAKAQDEARQDPLCSVPLRVGLVPITGRSAGAAASEQAASPATEPEGATRAGPTGPFRPIGTITVMGLPMLDMGRQALSDVERRIREANPKGDKSEFDLRDEAREAERSNDFDKAQSHWVAALHKSIDYDAALNALKNHKRLDLVFALYQTRLPASAQPKHLAYYGLLAKELGRRDVTLAFADALGTRFPDRPETISLGARLYHAAEDPARACALYMRALDAASDLQWSGMDGYRTHASCDLAVALPKVEALVKRNPTAYYAWVELAHLYASQSRSADVCRAVAQAAKLRPEYDGHKAFADRCP